MVLKAGMSTPFDAPLYDFNLQFDMKLNIKEVQKDY